MVGGVLYTTGGTRRSVVALDAQSGELLWVHRYPEGTRGAARTAPALGTRRSPTGPTAEATIACSTSRPATG